MDTPASARHKRGCNCKKSLCLKKYCECYQVGACFGLTNPDYEVLFWQHVSVFTSVGSGLSSSSIVQCVG